MAWTCRLDNVEDQNTHFAFTFTVLNNGVRLISDTILISASTLSSIASDGRLLYVRNEIKAAAKKYLVVKAVASEFTQYIGQQFALPDPTFRTQTEIDAEPQVVQP